MEWAFLSVEVCRQETLPEGGRRALKRSAKSALALRVERVYNSATFVGLVAARPHCMSVGPLPAVSSRSRPSEYDPCDSGRYVPHRCYCFSRFRLPRLQRMASSMRERGRHSRACAAARSRARHCAVAARRSLPMERSTSSSAARSAGVNSRRLGLAFGRRCPACSRPRFPFPRSIVSRRSRVSSRSAAAHRASPNSIRASQRRVPSICEGRARRSRDLMAKGSSWASSTPASTTAMLTLKALAAAHDILLFETKYLGEAEVAAYLATLPAAAARPMTAGSTGAARRVRSTT